MSESPVAGLEQPSSGPRTRGGRLKEMPVPVAVFTPSPLLTVTVEAGWQNAPEIHLHAGGQGVWVARMAQRLGASVTLAAPFGGETGQVTHHLLKSEGLTVAAITTRGANGAYVHDRRQGERIEVAETQPPELSRHEVDDLYGAALLAGIDARVIVLTGPAHPRILPVDVYRRLAADLAMNGVFVVADLSGEARAAALSGGVKLIKVSHDELIADGYMADGDDKEVVAGVDRLLDDGAKNVIVSRAAEPAIAVVDGRLLRIIPPPLEALDHRGAGDSMTAAMAVAIARGLDTVEALQMATAAGALNAARRGLGTGRRAEIERLAARVVVEALSR